MKKHKKEQPIALVPLVEEHNEIVLFCERIREGLQRKIDPKRMKKYSDWFKKEYLDPHFEIEKKYSFPILGENNVRIKRASANHRRLDRLFSETTEIHKVLHKIEEELSAYIGFEERIIYNEIREIATTEQLCTIEQQHLKLDFSDEEWKDRFWEK